ncbi:MAG: hypothetical protein Q9M92_15820 [Enterobacterales bacterium]|nr:hypothetical protein [Enterobacterales bacterium]
MGALAIIFVVDMTVTTAITYLATLISRVSIQFDRLLVIVAMSAIISLIPSIGWFLGIALFLYLMVKSSNANLTDALWVVVFSKLFSMGAVLLLFASFNLSQ